MTRQDRIAALKAAAKQRILILDGAWGVMIQRRGLAEADYRGERFADHPGQLKREESHARARLKHEHALPDVWCQAGRRILEQAAHGRRQKVSQPPRTGMR